MYIDLRTRDFRNAFRWDKILYTNIGYHMLRRLVGIRFRFVGLVRSRVRIG